MKTKIKMALFASCLLSSAAFAADPCAGKVQDTSAAGKMALKIATYYGLKPQVKDLLFTRCVSIETPKQSTIPTAFFAQDIDTFNWYLQRGFDVKTKIDTKNKGNILLYKIATMNSPSLPVSGLAAYQSDVKAYGIDISKITPRNFNTTEDQKLLNQLAEKLPDEIIQETDGAKNNAMYYAIRFGQPEIIKILSKRSSDIYTQKNDYGFLPTRALWAKPCVSASQFRLGAFAVYSNASKDVLEEKSRPEHLYGQASYDPSMVDYAIYYNGKSPLYSEMYTWTYQREGKGNMDQAFNELNAFKKATPDKYDMVFTVQEGADFCSIAANS